MAQATAIKMDNNNQTLVRLEVENDFREQMALSAGQTVDYDQPVLVMSRQRLRANARRFIAAMPRVRPHFAVKANPDKEILRIFKDEGTCFEIASIAELDAMVELGADMDTVFYSNPIKSPQSIKHATDHGVIWYCVDTHEEVEKIAMINPQAKLYLRIAVSNEGSSWPLAGKFGAGPAAVEAIIAAAKQFNMQICGVTFHVGSQCCNIDNWVAGIRAAKQLFAKLISHGFMPHLLNLGGGYPLQFNGDEPVIEQIGEAINRELEDIPQSVQVMAEPGRYLVGSAGCLVSQIVGVATRDDARWVYLDTGVYGGLMELTMDFPLSLVSERTGDLGLWTLAGPTCDSIDVMGRHQLPTNSAAGDFVYMPNLGAYCTTCACDFNGFPAPILRMVD
ncbi:MAG: type III PLP-dependent enzyme [Porticoccaceae bacterium]